MSDLSDIRVHDGYPMDASLCVRMELDNRVYFCENAIISMQARLNFLENREKEASERPSCCSLQ